MYDGNKINDVQLSNIEYVLKPPLLVCQLKLNGTGTAPNEISSMSKLKYVGDGIPIVADELAQVGVAGT